MQIDDLIEYEPESTRLDFKKTQYFTKDKAEFLRDVLAMANADTSEDRFIICGVKKLPDGNAQVHPIAPEDFVDAAELQQLIQANVEPHLDVAYEPHESPAGGLVGIVRITGCVDPPYMMRKDLSPLQRGDMWIRKGTTRLRVTRTDLDRMSAIRSVQPNQVIVEWPTGSTTLSLMPLSSDYIRPSERLAIRIRGILDRRKREPLSSLGRLARQINLAGPFGQVPLEERSTESLESTLASLNDDYTQADEHDLCELHAHHVNLLIRNDGEQYVEDGSLELVFPVSDSFIVVPEPVDEPEYEGVFRVPRMPSLWIHYPTVTGAPGEPIRVLAKIGDIPHRLPTPAFSEPLRLVLLPLAEGQTISLQYRLHGRNLRTPIEGSLAIECHTNGQSLRPVDTQSEE